MNEMDELTLQTTLYEIYRENWMSNNVSAKERAEIFTKYKLINAVDRVYESFDDYLWENGGFNGSLYVCFGEFLDAEYLDREFISGLIDNAHLEEDIAETILAAYDLYENELTRE